MPTVQKPATFPKAQSIYDFTGIPLNTKGIQSRQQPSAAQSKFISRQKMQEIATNAPDAKEAMKYLVEKGYTIEGFNDEGGIYSDYLQKQKEASSTITSRIGEKWSERGKDFGEAFRKNDGSNKQLAAGILQGVGALVGGVTDVAGEVLGTAAGKLDDITGNVVSDSAKAAGSAIGDTELGKMGIAAAGKGYFAYMDWAKENPDAARSLEGAANIGGFLAIANPAAKGLKYTTQAAKDVAKIAAMTGKATLGATGVVAGKTGELAGSAVSLVGRGVAGAGDMIAGAGERAGLKTLQGVGGVASTVGREVSSVGSYADEAASKLTSAGKKVLGVTPDENTPSLKGLTDDGVEFDIPDGTAGGAMDRLGNAIKERSLSRLKDVENKVIDKKTGETSLQNLSNRAVMPKVRAYDPNVAKKVTESLGVLHALQRSGKLGADLAMETIQDGAIAVQKGLEVVGREIGDIIEGTAGRINVQPMINSLTTVVGRGGFGSNIERLAKEAIVELSDKAKNGKISLKRAQEIKSQLFDEVKLLTRRGEDGKNPVYRELLKTHTSLVQLIDEAIDLAGDSGPLKALKKQYGALKNISEDINKSALVDARKSPQSLIEQMAEIETFSINPAELASNYGKKQIAQAISAANSRNGAFQEAMRIFDKESSNRYQTSQGKNSGLKEAETEPDAVGKKSSGGGGDPIQDVEELMTRFGIGADSKLEDLKRFASDPQVRSAIKDAYAAKYGNTIDVDNVREFLGGKRGIVASTNHEVASGLAREILEETLERNKGAGKAFILLAGGGGSGKSGINSAMKQIFGDSPMYDGTLKDYAGALRIIQQGESRGYPVHIAYTHRPILSAWQGVLSRAIKTGRTLPISEFLKAHKGARETIQKLRKEGKVVQFFDNSGGPGDARDISSHEFLKLLQKDDISDEAIEKMRNIATMSLSRGEITRDQLIDLLR